MPADLFDDDNDDEMEDSDEELDDESEEDEEEEERPVKDVTPGIQPQEKQGVFADKDSVFDSKKKADHRNPVVTRAEETANQLLPMRRPVTTKAQLVAIFDSQGRPFVAYHQNGRALEKFRLPTPQEFEVLRARGQIVKGGLGDAATVSTPTTGTSDQPKNRTWLWVGAAAVGVGAAAWWYMKRQKDKEAPRRNRRRSVEEMDDMDDED